VERLLTLDPAGFAGAIVGIAAAGAVIASRRPPGSIFSKRWSNDSVRQHNCAVSSVRRQQRRRNTAHCRTLIGAVADDDGRMSVLSESPNRSLISFRDLGAMTSTSDEALDTFAAIGDWAATDRVIDAPQREGGDAPSVRRWVRGPWWWPNLVVAALAASGLLVTADGAACPTTPIADESDSSAIAGLCAFIRGSCCGPVGQVAEHSTSEYIEHRAGRVLPCIPAVTRDNISKIHCSARWRGDDSAVRKPESRRIGHDNGVALPDLGAVPGEGPTNSELPVIDQGPTAGSFGR